MCPWAQQFCRVGAVGYLARFVVCREKRVAKKQANAKRVEHEAVRTAPMLAVVPFRVVEVPAAHDRVGLAELCEPAKQCTPAVIILSVWTCA